VSSTGILNRRLLAFKASDDVASTIHQSLPAAAAARQLAASWFCPSF